MITNSQITDHKQRTTARLQYREQPVSGRTSISIVYYTGATKNEAGITPSVREYETLKLYYFDKPKNPAQKDEKKYCLDLAKEILAVRQDEIKRGVWNLKAEVQNKVKVCDYFQDFAEKHKEPRYTYILLRGVAKQLMTFSVKNYRREITFSDVDTKFCEDFKNFILKEARSKKNKPFANGTAHNYFQSFKSVFNMAVKDNIILKSPADAISIAKKNNHKRDYLTFEELRALRATHCQDDELKRAFLFSCLTGLRWCDIEKLKWKEVQRFGEGWKVNFQQQKTKGIQYHDISQQARDVLGEYGKPDDNVFSKLRYSNEMLQHLQQWVNEAGISKKITFHNARHSYAVLLISHGTSIITVSEMLGHSNIKTTMIYSQVMDEKRLEAANIVPSIF